MGLQVVGEGGLCDQDVRTHFPNEICNLVDRFRIILEEKWFVWKVEHADIADTEQSGGLTHLLGLLFDVTFGRLVDYGRIAFPFRLPQFVQIEFSMGRAPMSHDAHGHLISDFRVDSQSPRQTTSSHEGGQIRLGCAAFVRSILSSLSSPTFSY